MRWMAIGVNGDYANYPITPTTLLLLDAIVGADVRLGND